MSRNKKWLTDVNEKSSFVAKEWFSQGKARNEQSDATWLLLITGIISMLHSILMYTVSFRIPKKVNFGKVFHFDQNAKTKFQPDKLQI